MFFIFLLFFFVLKPRNFSNVLYHFLTGREETPHGAAPAYNISIPQH